jgi:hypothetical protein
MNITGGECGIPDYKSPSGKTNRLKMAGFARQLRSDLPPRMDAGTWEVLCEIRLPDAITAPAGTAFKAGIYSYGTNWAVKTVREFPADALSRNEYRLFSLGTVDFKRTYQLYIESISNPSIPELLAGRIFLRKVKQ